MLPTIAQALGIAASVGGGSAASLRDALGDRRPILVLDKLELLVASGPQLTTLLSVVPGLTILATSRAPLRVRAEHEFPVVPLLTPVSPVRTGAADSLANTAIALFVDRARAANPSFALTDANGAEIAAICARLDGLPLAIELAAARTAVLSPKALLARLTDRLTLLTPRPGDLPTRQRTLGRAIAWSYDLLSADDQSLLRGLSVVAGGFTIEGVEAVMGDFASPEWGRQGQPSPSASLSTFWVLDGLDRLVAQSLVVREKADGEPRFRLLDSVREFATARLRDAGEYDAVAERHLRWCVGIAEQADAGLTGAEQREWHKRLDVECDNIRTGLSWALGDESAMTEAGQDVGHRHRAELGLRLAAALWRFWSARGFLCEGQEWLRRAIAVAPGVSPDLRAKAANNLGNLAKELGDLSAARDLYELALSPRREGDDRGGDATIVGNLGLLAIVQGDYARAIALLEESLRNRRDLDDRPGLALSLGNLGDAAIATGQFERAAEQHQEALVSQQALGDEAGIAYALHNAAEAARHRGDRDQGRRLYRRSIDLFRIVGDRRGLGFPLVGLSRLALLEGETACAAELLGEALELRRELGDRQGIIECLEALAALTIPLGFGQDGIALIGAASATRDALGVPLPHAERAEHQRLSTSLGRLVSGDSSRTVHGHLYRIVNTLGVSTRAAATRIALVQGWL